MASATSPSELRIPPNGKETGTNRCTTRVRVSSGRNRRIGSSSRTPGSAMATTILFVPRRPPPDVVPRRAPRQLFDQDGARTLRDMLVGERRSRATRHDGYLEAAVHEQRSDDLPEFGGEHAMSIVGRNITQKTVRADHRTPRQPGDVR